MGENTWQWAFTDLTGNWLPADTLEFKLEKAHDIVNSYTLTSVNVPVVYNENLRVFPNPARTELVVDGVDLNTALSVLIFNVIGQQRATRLSDSNKINVSDLESGLYLLRIIDAEGRMSTVRFIKQ